MYSLKIVNFAFKNYVCLSGRIGNTLAPDKLKSWLRWYFSQ